MGLDIPMNKKGAMNKNSLVNKQGLMNVRGSLDRRTLNNKSFCKNPVVRNTMTENTSVRPQKKRVSGGGMILKKGQKIAIAETRNIKIALGWDILDSRCEVDASAFMLGGNNKVIGDEWFIFYGQDTSPDGSVKYSTVQNSDDAVIDINLTRVNPMVQKIVFSVTIYEAVAKRLNFGMTENVYARIIDSNNREFARFQLDECYSNVTAMVLGELYRYNGSWKFNAVGSGVAKDLAGFCAMYGVNII